MTQPLPASVLKVEGALRAVGIAPRIVMLADAARTSQQAADALGVAVDQIAKSLVFKARANARAVLVIARGGARVDEAKVAAALGEPIGRADPAFVRDVTGYAIGGIPPIGHAQPLFTFVDETLAQFDEVWAAAGHPHAVFPIAPQALFRIAGGRVADVIVRTP